MITDAIYEEAAYWLGRQQDEAMDWDGFTSWLEADPRHRVAYDELALIDSRLDDYARQTADAASDAPVVENDRRRWRMWAGFSGGAVAAGLALLLVLQPTHRIPVHDYRSARTAILPISLSDGARVVLAPASRLIVQGDRMVLRGSAFFDVPHNPRQPLAITVGEFQVADIGTRFSIDDEGDAIAIDVAAGSVVVKSAALQAPVSLSAGHGMRADSAAGTIRVVSIDPQQVASWRTGELQFDDVPLALVAREISRYSGEDVTVDPAIAGQPFSGVIAIHHGDAPARTVAQILSLSVKKMDGGLRLEPHRP